MGKGEAAKKAAAFAIDFEGIGQRILSFPLPTGNYVGLLAGSAGQVYYLVRAETGEGGRGPRGGGGGFGGATLHRYDIDRQRDSTVQAGVTSYELTPDGRKMLYSTGGGNWFITSTAGTGGAAPAPSAVGSGRGPRTQPPAPAPSPSGGAGGDGKINLETIEVRVEPRAEWKQIFDESWRINRDFFYDPNMHGTTWTAVKAKYEPFLPHVTSSTDLYRVIGWMLSELAVGHSRYTPGERVHERKTVQGGLLGADYEVVDGRYRFKKIYGGLNWTSALRSPLTAPGVNVKEGEFLLAVNGKELRAPTEIYSLFENSAGKLTDLNVGPSADGKGSRTVTVEPIASELNLRNMDWIEGNLRKVEKATGGRVGYVYVRDTAGGGMADFKRYFFPQVDKDALIIDERFNSGGQIADYYIDILRRPFASYWAPRHGADNRSPSAAVLGPKVMIIDEGAGSGGDMLPFMFRKFGLGPLVGKRTWGGLVGISGTPVLMDGGSVTAPSFAIWVPDGGWIVENEGVPPDHDVTMWPKDVIAGKDPQLDKAIELALEGLKKNPPQKHARPDYPVRAKQ
jgi:tricorn protease